MEEDDDDDGAARPPQQVYLNEPSHVASSLHQQQHAIDLAIRRDRERDGRCGDCGAQTHELRYDQLAGSYMKVPLTVNGEVHRGRCLLCLPVNALEDQRQGTSRPVVAACNNSSAAAGSKNNNCCNHTSPSSVRRRVSGLTSALGLYDPCDPAARNALHSLIDGNNDIVDILFAMKRVPHDPVIQERGCERLWILSWEDDNAISVGRVGGITIILAAMARFPKNSYLQQCGCESLQNLAALDEYNRREIAEQGGIDLIVRCMVNHVTVAGIQRGGCTALASMAAAGEFNKDICRAGGIHALILAARQFADEEGVLRCVQDACQAMGFDPKTNCHPIQMEATSTR